MAIAVSMSIRASAQPPLDRRSWALESLAIGPAPTALDERRSRFSLGASQFGDVLVLRGEGLLSFGMLELRARTARHWITGFTAEGAALRSAYETRVQWLGLELASQTVSLRGESGRLSLEFLRALPAGEDYVKLSLQTALLPTTDRPWRFWLETAYFIALRKDVGKALSVRLTLDRTTASGWSFGGAAQVTYRTERVTGPGVYESALVSLGPTLRYGNFTAGANARVVVDTRVFTDGAQRSLSGLRPPDVYLGWDLR
jgi:hypothetical protein